MTENTPAILVKDLTIAYDDLVVLKDLSFEVAKSDIFIIMGASGCGKSSLLRILTGLTPATGGKIEIFGEDLTSANPEQKHRLMEQCGVLYQGGALFSSMTLLENVSLPLQYYSDMTPTEISKCAEYNLSLVELADFADYYPSEISGGMKKRAGLARAMVMEPEILYFDEPSAGLDPISARELDDLILKINKDLHTTIVVVSHDLESIFAIGNKAIFLDVETKKIIAQGAPQELLKNPPNDVVYQFLTRGGERKNAQRAE